MNLPWQNQHGVRFRQVRECFRANRQVVRGNGSLNLRDFLCADVFVPAGHPGYLCWLGLAPRFAVILSETWEYCYRVPNVRGFLGRPEYCLGWVAVFGACQAH